LPAAAEKYQSDFLSDVFTGYNIYFFQHTGECSEQAGSALKLFRLIWLPFTN